MKDIKILIRFDDDGNRMGFAIDRKKSDAESSAETLKLIGALEMLKDREKKRLERIQTFKMER